MKLRTRLCPALVIAVFCSVPAFSSLGADLDSGFRQASPLRRTANAAAFGGAAVRVALDPAALATLRSQPHAVVGDFPLTEGLSVDLDLHQIEVFAPDAQLVVAHLDKGGQVIEAPLAKPDVVLFGGTVLGQPDAQVFLSLSPGSGSQGYILHNGTRYTISTGPAGAGLDTLVYNADALPADAINWKPFTCGSDDLIPIAPPKAAAEGAAKDDGGIAGPPPPPCRQVQFAVETDAEYTANVFGGNLTNAAAYVATLLGASSQIYTNEVNTRFQITYLRLWDSPADPWDQTDTVNQLFQYRDYWAANMTSVPRTLGHFLSGRGLGGGVAWLSVVCDPEYGFGLSANLGGSFPYPLQNNNGQNWDIMVVSHEIGHNFGTGHTHDYVPPIDGCGLGDCTDANLGTIMSYCHTCSGGMSNIVLTLHPIVIQTVLNYLATGPTCDLTGATLPPYAATDFASTIQGGSLTLDVQGNDVIANCDAITMTAFDASSVHGGTVTLSAGTGPGGRDQLIYVAPINYGGSDSFTYTIKDSQNLFATGTVSIEVIALRPADSPTQSQPGVRASFYALAIPVALPDFNTLTAFRAQELSQVNLPSTNGNFAGSGLSDNVGAVFKGYISVPTAGVYTLSLESDDGSRLLIGDTVLVNNDGLHGMVEKSGSIGLQPGKHATRIEFFEAGGGAGLIARFAGPGIIKQVIPPGNWFRTVPADVDSSGSVNIDDLLAVINAWGACPMGVLCPADVNHNGQINIDDLLAVINNWG